MDETQEETAQECPASEAAGGAAAREAGNSSDTHGSQTQHAETVCFNDMFTRMAGGSAGGAISREQFAAFLQENGRQLLGAEEEEEEELQALLSDMVDEAFQTTAQLSRAQFIAFLSSTSDAPCLDADAPPGPPGDADLGGGGGGSSSSSQGASIQSNAGADGPAAAQVVGDGGGKGGAKAVAAGAVAGSEAGLKRKNGEHQGEKLLTRKSTKTRVFEGLKVSEASKMAAKVHRLLAGDPAAVVLSYN